MEAMKRDLVHGAPGRPALDWARLDLWIVPILLAAAALRVVTAGYSLWLDEIASVTLARQPIELLWSSWMVRESNPPLYYTILSGWMRLFGSGDVAVQSLSILIGLLGIVAAWLLARRVGGRAAGLIAAGLLALSAAHLDFSQEVRGYILAHTAVLWSCIGIVAYLERPRLLPLSGYAVAALMAVYSHTTLVVFVAIANVAMLWLLRSNAHALVRWMAANMVILLLWAWWGWISYTQLGSPSGFAWITRPDLAGALQTTAIVYSPLYLAAEQITASWLLGLVWIVGLAWFAFSDRRPGVLMLAALAIGCPLILWGISQKVPILLPRTLFWAAGPAAVLVALAISSVRSSAVRLALVATLLALQIGAIGRWLPLRESEAWPAAIRTVAHASPKDRTLIVEGDPVALCVEHYLPRSGISVLVLRTTGDADPWAAGLSTLPKIDRAELGRLVAQRRSVFTLTRGDYDSRPVLRELATEYPLPGVTNERRPLLSVWRAKGTP